MILHPLPPKATYEVDVFCLGAKHMKYNCTLFNSDPCFCFSSLQDSLDSISQTCPSHSSSIGKTRTSAFCLMLFINALYSLTIFRTVSFTTCSGDIPVNYMFLLYSATEQNK